MRASRLVRETVRLRDGRTVVLRPVQPTDARLLIDLHGELSYETQYFRFFGPKPVLSPAEAEYLANVDFVRRFAIAAAVRADAAEALVAVGRFDLPPEESVAEPAIVVRDDYQGVGLGRAILERMRELARGRGVREFSAEILAENHRMLDLLRQQGLHVSDPSNGVVTVTAPVANAPLMLRGLGVVARSTASIVDRATGPLRRREPDDRS